jgi:hypothetical protein
MVVQNGSMSDTDRPLRQSVSLAPRVARRVRALARNQRTSASRVIADLVESGLEVREQERRRFLDLADRLTRSDDLGERERIKAELARMTFGT